jgi:hypothetical protein
MKSKNSTSNKNVFYFKFSYPLVLSNFHGVKKFFDCFIIIIIIIIKKKYYIEKKSYDPQFNISDIEYTNIKTSIEKVDLIYQDYKSHKKYNSIKRKELSEALNRIFLNFENLKISDYNGYKIIQETKKIINNDFVKNFFDQWEINSTISDKSFFFNEKNFDINQLKKNILNSYKFQEKRFNYKEWLSLNIFSIVFAFVIYFIYKNFKKN